MRETLISEWERYLILGRLYSIKLYELKKGDGKPEGWYMYKVWCVVGSFVM